MQRSGFPAACPARGVGLPWRGPGEPSEPSPSLRRSRVGEGARAGGVDVPSRRRVQWGGSRASRHPFNEDPTTRRSLSAGMSTPSASGAWPGQMTVLQLLGSQEEANTFIRTVAADLLLPRNDNKSGRTDCHYLSVFPRRVLQGSAEGNPRPVLLLAETPERSTTDLCAYGPDRRDRLRAPEPNSAACRRLDRRKRLTGARRSEPSLRALALESVEEFCSRPEIRRPGPGPCRIAESPSAARRGSSRTASANNMWD